MAGQRSQQNRGRRTSYSHLCILLVVCRCLHMNLLWLCFGLAESLCPQVLAPVSAFGWIHKYLIRIMDLEHVDEHPHSLWTKKGMNFCNISMDTYLRVMKKHTSILCPLSCSMTKILIELRTDCIEEHAKHGGLCTDKCPTLQQRSWWTHFWSNSQDWLSWSCCWIRTILVEVQCQDFGARNCLNVET